MQRLRFLVWKEFLELRKNPRLFGVVVVAPIVQLTMLGYAATTDVRDVPVVVADGDRSPASRELIARFEASRNFTIVGRSYDAPARSSPIWSAARAWLALSIPTGYGARRRRRRAGDVQVDRRRQRFELDHRRARLRHQPDRRLRAGTRRARGRPPASAAGPAASTPRIRVWFNPQLESRYFMIPGVLALVLLVVTANLASMAIVREKELGTLEQLNVTPLRRWELIVGKLLPYGVDRDGRRRCWSSRWRCSGSRCRCVAASRCSSR